MKTLIATFDETDQIGKKIAKQIKAEYTKIEIKSFPDSESYVRFKTNPKNKKVFIISSMAHNINTKIIETLLAGRTAKDYKAKSVNLIATYFPYMRQDIHFKPYESLSAAPITETFSKFFDKIYTMDPHLQRIHTMKTLSKNVQEITTNKIIAEYISKNFKGNYEIIGPDKESSQWAKKIADLVGKESKIFSKNRFSSWNVAITGKTKSKEIIIIDDIISTGRTILKTISLAKKEGVKKITVIGIHGVLISDSAKKISKHSKLITTNTIPNKFSKIDISPIIKEIILTKE